MSFDPMNSGMPPMPPQGGPPQGPPQGLPPGGPPMGPPGMGGPPPQMQGLGAAPPMKNLMQLWDEMKSWPDEKLMQELQSPSGLAPVAIIAAAQEERNSERERYQNAVSQQPETTVYDDLLAQAQAMAPPPPPPGMGGPPGMDPGMDPGLAGAMPPDMMPPGDPGMPIDMGMPPGMDPSMGMPPGPPMMQAANGAYPVQRYAEGGYARRQFTPYSEEEILALQKKHGLTRDEAGRILDPGTFYGERPDWGERFEESWSEATDFKPVPYVWDEFDPHGKTHSATDFLNRRIKGTLSWPADIASGIHTPYERPDPNETLSERGSREFGERFGVREAQEPWEDPHVASTRVDTGPRTHSRADVASSGFFGRPEPGWRPPAGTGRGLDTEIDILEVASGARDSQLAPPAGAPPAAAGTSAAPGGYQSFENYIKGYNEMVGPRPENTRLNELSERLTGLEQPKQNTWSGPALMQVAAAFLSNEPGAGGFASRLGTGMGAAAPTIMSGMEQDRKSRTEALRTAIDLERVRSAEDIARHRDKSAVFSEYQRGRSASELAGQQSGYRSAEARKSEEFKAGESLLKRKSDEEIAGARSDRSSSKIWDDHNRKVGLDAFKQASRDFSSWDEGVFSKDPVANEYVALTDAVSRARPGAEQDAARIELEKFKRRYIAGIKLRMLASSGGGAPTKGQLVIE